MSFHCKILVTEDNPETREALVGLLTDCGGYDVISAANGKDALLLTKSPCPDVILLDLGLPDINGIPVLQNIRKWSSVPVIVVSARSEECIKVEAFENGADEYVQKPFQDRELLARIKVALKHSHSSGSNSSIALNSRFEVRDLVIDYQKYRVLVGNKEIELTQNEFRLVALLGQYAGYVLPYSEIIRRM